MNVESFIGHAVLGFWVCLVVAFGVFVVYSMRPHNWLLLRGLLIGVLAVLGMAGLGYITEAVFRWACHPYWLTIPPEWGSCMLVVGGLFMAVANLYRILVENRAWKEAIQ